MLSVFPLAAARFALCAVLVASVLLPSALAFAQTAANVAVVINDDSPVSQRVGAYYIQKRAIPERNVIRIRASASEAIDRAEYSRAIETPVATAISERNLHDDILYIVLTKGVPLRITGTTGANGTAASVDSELTLLYRRMTGVPPPASGRIDNPYFLRDAAPATLRSFTHREHDIFLVTRLDGFTEQDVMGLIDRGIAPSPAGGIVLDGRDPLLDRVAEGWLAAAAARLATSDAKERVVLDATPQAVRPAGPVLGYYSWGSLDEQHLSRTLGLPFAAGAIASTFVPSSARTFEPPPAGWQPSIQPRSLPTPESQTLIGDLIAEGVTGVAGHIAEPYMQGMVRPDVLFPAYFAGANLAEAFYAATPYLSWQTVVVGDPLTAPFRRTVLTAAQIADPVDPEMQLPRIFAQRQVAQMRKLLPGMTERAAVLGVRGTRLLARGDRDGARVAFEEALTLEPRATLWQFQLATFDEAAQRYDAAIARYRRILEQEQNHVAALNNLAYALAVHKKSPADALPFAKRAASLARSQPLVVDTLGWIEHLLGNDKEALRLLQGAAASAPAQPEIRFHLAVVQAALGATTLAEAELAEALRLDPELGKRPDVVELRRRLGAKSAEPAAP